MQHDSTPSDADKQRKRPQGRRLLLPAVETFSEEALDGLVDCYALLQQIARRKTGQLDDGEGTDAAAAEAETIAPPPAKRRTRRPSPKRLAKWEAHWQAEQAAEGER